MPPYCTLSVLITPLPAFVACAGITAPSFSLTLFSPSERLPLKAKIRLTHGTVRKPPNHASSKPFPAPSPPPPAASHCSWAQAWLYLCNQLRGRTLKHALGVFLQSGKGPRGFYSGRGVWGSFHSHTALPAALSGTRGAGRLPRATGAWAGGFGAAGGGRAPPSSGAAAGLISVGREEDAWSPGQACPRGCAGLQAPLLG